MARPWRPRDISGASASASRNSRSDSSNRPADHSASACTAIASGLPGESSRSAGRFALRLLELADQQRRLHDADARAHPQRGVVGVGGPTERLARFVEARLVVEQARRAGTAARHRRPARGLRATVPPRHTSPRPAHRERPSAYWPSLGRAVTSPPGCSRARRRRRAQSIQRPGAGRRPACPTVYF